MFRSRVLLPVVAFVLACTLVQQPAHAAEALFFDERGDAPARIDVERVKVVHMRQAVRVIVKIRDLRRTENCLPDRVTVFVDTLRDRVGPEFYGGIGGCHYTFGGMRRWQSTGPTDPDDPFTDGCRGFRMRYDYRLDRVSMRFPRTRECIGLPGRVRVSVETERASESGEPDAVTDWAPQRRTFYPWVQVN